MHASQDVPRLAPPYIHRSPEESSSSLRSYSEESGLAGRVSGAQVGADRFTKEKIGGSVARSEGSSACGPGEILERTSSSRSMASHYHSHLVHSELSLCVAIICTVPSRQ